MGGLKDRPCTCSGPWRCSSATNCPCQLRGVECGPQCHATIFKSPREDMACCANGDKNVTQFVAPQSLPQHWMDNGHMDPEVTDEHLTRREYGDNRNATGMRGGEGILRGTNLPMPPPRFTRSGEHLNNSRKWTLQRHREETGGLRAWTVEPMYSCMQQLLAWARPAEDSTFKVLISPCQVANHVATHPAVRQLLQAAEQHFTSYNLDKTQVVTGYFLPVPPLGM